MAKIGELWAGKLFGTNTGNLSAEFSSSETGFFGTIRFLDDKWGLVVYQVTGTFDGSTIQLTGKPTQSPPDIQTADISAKGALTPEGQIKGQWLSALGTGGPFALFPHDIPVRENGPAQKLPEQLHTANKAIGAIQLYTEDVRGLVDFLRRDFSQDRTVVVTYNDRGTEVSRYAQDFLSDTHHLGQLRYLKLAIQEPEAYGINRLAQIELSSTSENQVRVQGVQESWVRGKAESLASELHRHERFFITSFRKFGLNINGLLFLAALVLLPELTLLKRIIFIIVLVLTLAVIVWLHRRFIRNATISFSEKPPSIFVQTWPQILSWVIAASAAFVAAVAYGILSGQLPNFLVALFHR